MCISIPVGICLLRIPYDRGLDDMVSDWDFLKDWIQHYQIDREFWDDFWGAMICSFGVSFAVGLIMQYVITSIWHLVKRKRV